MLLVFLALACRPKGAAEDTDREPVPDTEVPGDPWVGIEEMSLDTETWAELGYDVAWYEVTPDAIEPYTTIQGTNPGFYVVRPKVSEGPVPVLLWLHGGSIGDDSTEIPEGCDESAGLAAALIKPNQLAARMAMLRGWAVVVPVNGFCDSWFGLGAADEVDPERHWGHAHIVRALDFARADRAGFDASGTLYGWGTSAGASGVIFAASRYPGFDGLIADSPPCDLYLYAQEDPIPMIHLFGGVPASGDADVAARYEAASCDRTVRDGLVTAPIYVAWNQRDVFVADEHPQSLITALDTAYGPARHGSHDFDHDAPGTTFHVQSRVTRPPFGYTTKLMFRFLDGESVVWAEAEAGCGSPGCTVGTVITSSEEPVANFSRQSGREALAADGPGVLYRGGVPDGVPRDVEVVATAILMVSGTVGLPETTPVGRLQTNDGAVKELTLADFAPEGADPAKDGALIVDQLQSTAVTFTMTGPGGVIWFETDGLVDVRLDAIAYTY